MQCLLRYGTKCDLYPSLAKIRNEVDLDLSITNGIVSSKIYHKWNDFNFEIVNFPFLDGDIPHSPSYGAYISLLIRLVRICFNVDDFNKRNQIFDF